MGFDDLRPKRARVYGDAWEEIGSRHGAEAPTCESEAKSSPDPEANRLLAVLTAVRDAEGHAYLCEIAERVDRAGVMSCSGRERAEAVARIRASLDEGCADLLIQFEARTSLYSLTKAGCAHLAAAEPTP